MPVNSAGMSTVFDLSRLEDELEREGFALLPDFLPRAKLDELEAFVRAEVARQPAGYIGSVGKETVRGSPLEHLDVEAGLLDVLQRAHERLLGPSCPDRRLYQVLRVLYGKGEGEKQAHQFHFDAYALTALLPIAIPDRHDGRNGDLILFTKRRRLHTNLLLNLLQKFLVQNPLSRRLLTWPSIQRRLGARIVKLVPGNLYLFLGFQTCHGNAPCSVESMRATALFHYSDPFHASRFVRALENVNVRRTERRRQRAAAAR